MKVAIVLLLSAVALWAGSAHAADGILGDRVRLGIMCEMYSNTAKINATMRDQGTPYADARAQTERIMYEGAAKSKQSRSDKAFMVEYITNAAAFAYIVEPQATPDIVRQDAMTHCRAQFGI